MQIAQTTQEPDFNSSLMEAFKKIDNRKRTLNRYARRSSIRMAKLILDYVKQETSIPMYHFISHFSLSYGNAKYLLACCMASDILNNEEGRFVITPKGIAFLDELNQLEKRFPWIFESR